jgi:hypothetical protein
MIQEASHNDKLKTICVAMLEAAELRLRDLVKASDDESDREAAQGALNSTRAALEILTEWYGESEE